MLPLNSWGNYPRVRHAAIQELRSRHHSIPFAELNYSVLAHGQGRSYGDSCLNENAGILLTKHLNHFIDFDPKDGILECEAGLTLSEILNVMVPRGWSLPVVPGTQYVSIGGAIANDVHGKNHHCAGTFGNYVLSFELLRSTGERVICTPNHNHALYQATIGGLGLTGLILSARLQLKPIASSQMQSENIAFNHLDHFFELSKSSERRFEYTVAWLDCVSTGKNFGRGIFMRANQTNSDQVPNERIKTHKKTLSIPFYFPNIALNPMSIQIFNHLYYKSQAKKKNIHFISYDKFFFPLDCIHNWNRIYGKRGFLQYQCVLPLQNALAIGELLKIIVNEDQGSFLSVLKMFGNKSSPGILSFPLEGVTLALDMVFRGDKTLKLLNQLDQEVMQLHGRVYPAKDARMSSEAFKTYFPMWQHFLRYKDPKFSSSFWRRVMKHEN